MEIKIEYSKKPLTSEKLEALLIFVLEDEDLSGSGLKSLPGDLTKNLKKLMKLKVFTGKKDKSHHLISDYAKIPQIVAFGLGKIDDLDAETLRRVAGKAGKMLTVLKANKVGFVVTSILQNKVDVDTGQVLVEGLTLVSYELIK